MSFSGDAIEAFQQQGWPAMTAGTADIHLKPDVLARLGLPDVAYPVPLNDLHSVLGDGGELPFALLLHGLQQKAQDGEAPWRALEPAMGRLAELAAPDDRREVVVARGDDWWLEIGPVDLGSRIVTLQRGDCLIAALCPRQDGRLRVAVYRPLDARSARYLIACALNPDPVHGVAMRENNWEYLLDSSCSTSHWYAAERGQAHLSRWDQGIGVERNGEVDRVWWAMRALVPRRAAVVATELGIHYVMVEEP